MWLLLAACPEPDPKPEDSAVEPEDSVPVDSADTTETGFSETTTCPEGEIPDGGRCVPEACGTGRWGNLVAGDFPIWVAAGSLDGDGSAERPYGTIDEAVARQAETILVAEGVYPETVLLVDGGVALLGRCAALVTLDAQGGNVALDIGKGPVATLSGFTVTGAADVGVAVRDQGAASIADSVIRGNAGIGVLVEGKDAGMIMARTSVEDTVGDAAEEGGIGISVQSGASAVLTGVTLVLNRQRGLYARGDGTEVDLTGVAISETDNYDDGSYGHGIAVDAGAIVTGIGVDVVANQEAGIWASGEGSGVGLTEVEVLGTLTSRRYHMGFGVLVTAGASVTLAGRVEGNEGPAVYVQDATFALDEGGYLAGMEFAALVVSGGTATLTGCGFGSAAASGRFPDPVGIWAGPGAGTVALRVEECTFEAEAASALWLTGAGSYEILGGSLAGASTDAFGILATDGIGRWDGTAGLHISGTAVGGFGVGILLDNASATVEGVAFSGNGTDLAQQHCALTETPDGDYADASICVETVEIPSIPWDIVIE